MSDDKQARYYERYERAQGRHMARRSARSGRATAVAGGAVAVAVAVGWGYLAFGKDGSPAAVTSTSASPGTTSSTGAPTTPAPSTSTASPTSTSSTSTSSSVSSSSSSAAGFEMTPPKGFTVVANGNAAIDRMMYAVPTGWTARPKWYVIAWATKKDASDAVGGHSVADLGSCKASSAYRSGTTAIGAKPSKTDPQKAAAALVAKLAPVVAADDSGKKPKTIPAAKNRTVKIADGKSATEATITLPYVANPKCGSKNVRITVVAAKTGGGTTTWFAVTDPADKRVGQNVIDSIERTITVR